MKGLMCLLTSTIGGEAILHSFGLRSSLNPAPAYANDYSSKASFFRPMIPTSSQHGHESLARNRVAKMRLASNASALNKGLVNSSFNASALTSALTEADFKFERPKTITKPKADSAVGVGNMDVDVLKGRASVRQDNKTMNATEDVRYTRTCSAACNWCSNEFQTHCFAKCYRGCYRHCDHWDRQPNCTLRTAWYASPALQPQVNNPGYFICQSDGPKRCPT